MVAEITHQTAGYEDALSVGLQSESSGDESALDLQNFPRVKVEDRELLQEEEERKKLLSPRTRHNAQSSVAPFSPQDRRRTQRKPSSSKQNSRRGRRRPYEKGELMYKLEEGGLRDDASPQSSSSSLDLDRAKNGITSTSKRRQTMRHISIAVVVMILFGLLTLGAFQGSHPFLNGPTTSFLSNGSSNFAPTTILISLDGFRADFLQRNITPTLNSFIAEGVSPKYMLPSFPSVTFPNHYTLVTGLYPESHGVVGNTFWDPELKEEFYYTDPKRSMQPKWWLGGEPLWVTAEKLSVKTAIHMWPGSEAHIQLEPTFLDKFNADELLSNKVDRILELLDTPSIGQTPEIIQRPQFIAAYVPVVDADGHKYGPNSTEICATIAGVDAMLHDLFTGLERRNLTKIVNIVVVSDHGMASTSTDRLVQLDDLIDLGLVEHIDGWPLYGLRPKNASDLDGLYNTLSAESIENSNFDVYLRDENMPERYHFSNNERIAPLWVVPKTGWAIVHKEDFDVKEAKLKGQTYHPRGLHGYDHEHPLMRAIFVAQGPAFPHKPNSELGIFQNTEVYNIVCDSLGIEPKPNNGTLRLPLTPIGLHSDNPLASDQIPQDLPQETSEAKSTAPKSITATSQNQTAHDESDEQDAHHFWDYLVTKFESAKVWVTGIFTDDEGDRGH